MGGKTLREMRASLAKYNRAGDLPSSIFDEDEVAELVEHVEALDGWITAGGFEPEAWK